MTTPHSEVREEIEKMLRENVWGYVCDCGGGGVEWASEGDTCSKCEGSGIFEWNYGLAVEKIEKLLLSKRQEWVESFYFKLTSRAFEIPKEGTPPMNVMDVISCESLHEEYNLFLAHLKEQS